MKWIKSYKIFEGEFDELNRYGYIGKIIDIDKNELQECVDKFNELTRFLTSPNNISELINYKDGSQNTNETYAYAANFTDELIPVNSVTEDYENFIGMLTICIFKDYKSTNNCLRLLKMDDGLNLNGYSLIFNSSGTFRTNILKKGNVIKVPENKNKVLTAMICYYIAHLESVGDKVSYGTNKKYKATVFKELLIKYLNYLLICGRTSDLFEKEMTIDEAYTVLHDAIIHSESRYEVLNNMKSLFPEVYKKLTGIGNEDSINMAASMGDMGFNENIIKYKTFEGINTERENYVKSEMKRFNDSFGKIGFKMTSYSWNSNTNYSFNIEFNFISDECIFKELLINIGEFEDLVNLNQVLPMNGNDYSVSKMEIQIAQGLDYGYKPRMADTQDKYNLMHKDYIYTSTNLMAAILRGICALFGSYSINSKDCFMFREKGAISGLKIELKFLQDTIVEYLKEWLMYDQPRRTISDDVLYKIIYDNVVKSGSISYRYFSYMKGSKLYNEMAKLSNNEIGMSDEMANMGFSD